MIFICQRGRELIIDPSCYRAAFSYLPNGQGKWGLEQGLVQFRGENGEFALAELSRCYHCDD